MEWCEYFFGGGVYHMRNLHTKHIEIKSQISCLKKTYGEYLSNYEYTKAYEHFL